MSETPETKTAEELFEPSFLPSTGEPICQCSLCGCKVFHVMSEELFFQIRCANCGKAGTLRWK